MKSITPYRVDIPQKQLDEIRLRVANYPWHEMPIDGGWEYGTNLDYLKELCAYWVDEFDWRQEEQKINQYPHFKTQVDGIDIHYIHAKSKASNPKPLIISHGWPGTIVEFLDIIDMLTKPEKYGGEVEDGFEVIAPSLPGFGFSGKPPRPYGPRKIASILNKLMVENLGFKRYISQGGDWGGAITSWLGYEHSMSCYAIHLNVCTMRHKDGPQGAEEIHWDKQFDHDQIMQNGYRTQQATKPQTLSYAMMDSPVGIAAWIIEKMYFWSDISNGDIQSVYTKDQLLANVMVYIVTKTFNTASWIYYGRREEGGRILSATGERVEVPTACALFPAEMLRWPPKSYADRIYHITQWTKMPKGGHFAAMEQPDLLAKDIIQFARSLK